MYWIISTLLNSDIFDFIEFEGRASYEESMRASKNITENVSIFVANSKRLTLQHITMIVMYIIIPDSMPPSLGPEATFPGTTRQGDQIQEPAIPTGDAYQRPKSLSTTVCHTETTPRSGH